MSSNTAPVIIKRKKVVAGGGHHGGAWKVAYADFVTAMMAFFMLMWLLNATTESQRKGIADYFNPTIPVNRISGGGEGMFGGDSVFSEEVLPQNGTGGSKNNPAAERQARGDSGVEPDGSGRQKSAETQVLKELADDLIGDSGESSVADDALKHVNTRVTDEGLIVELFDLPGAPLFPKEEVKPNKVLQELTAMITRVFSVVRNQVAISGHTRAYPLVLERDPGWRLSVERAVVVRKMLEQDGFDAARIERVAGWSNRKPANANPMSVRNNRIEIILLRSDPTGDSK